MRKLPVFGVLSHALRSVINNIRFAWHVSLPWLALLVPLGLAADFLLPRMDPQATDPATMARNSQAALGYLALGAFSMLVFSSIAVSWHRYILMDEIPQGMARLRLDAVVWRYFGNTLLVILLVIAACIPPVALLSLLTVLLGLGQGAATGATMAAAALIAIPLSYRLMVKLPAVAIGNNTFTMKEALSRTVGNALQLCMAGIIVIAAALLIGTLLGGLATLLGAGSGGAGAIVISVIQQLVSWLVTIFTVTFLTSLYGFFVEGRDF
jgi:hypothetical protein